MVAREAIEAAITFCSSFFKLSFFTFSPNFLRGYRVETLGIRARKYRKYDQEKI
jgi:hypothetical protein